MGCVIVTLKTCRQCGEAKEAAKEFFRHKGNADGRRAICKDCRSAEVRRWSVANPDRVRVTSRRRHLLRKYGLTLADYDQMLAAQGGLCDICQSPPESESNHYKPNLAVDHDHGTGQVRGLLCLTCNRTLGLIGDHNLAAAAAYIQKCQKITSKENSK